MSEDTHYGFWFRNGQIISLNEGNNCWRLFTVSAVDGKTNKKTLEFSGVRSFFNCFVVILSVDPKRIVCSGTDFILTLDLRSQTYSRKSYGGDLIFGSDSKGSIYSVAEEFSCDQTLRHYIRHVFISRQNEGIETKWNFSRQSSDWVKSICFADDGRIFISFSETLVELKLTDGPSSVEPMREWNIQCLELICYLASKTNASLSLICYPVTLISLPKLRMLNGRLLIL